ncbi:MAG: hypothetical protein NTY53_18735 [Kiritimatiellaeota bacterium]|nr:hypothetical protein [Kiritimatiellota bacterium]
MYLQHLRTLLWLRWRLTHNQWQRGGQISAIISLIVTISGVCLAVAGGVGGVLVGALAFAKATPLISMFVWDGIVAVFLFVWLLSLVTEIQRAETIDASRLMHLPVLLREVFFLNYVVSHVRLNLVIWVPTMFGLTLGLALARGVHMLWLVPLVLGFFFMITAWTYCLRGWLVALMVNPRRRRAVIMGVTMFFVVMAQLAMCRRSGCRRVRKPCRLVASGLACSQPPAWSCSVCWAWRAPTNSRGASIRVVTRANPQLRLWHPRTSVW